MGVLSNLSKRGVTSCFVDSRLLFNIKGVYLQEELCRLFLYLVTLEALKSESSVGSLRAVVRAASESLKLDRTRSTDGGRVGGRCTKLGVGARSRR